jgi:hypothetical protein
MERLERGSILLESALGCLVLVMITQGVIHIEHSSYNKLNAWYETQNRSWQTHTIDTSQDTTQYIGIYRQVTHTKIVDTTNIDSFYKSYLEEWRNTSQIHSIAACLLESEIGCAGNPVCMSNTAIQVPLQIKNGTKVSTCPIFNTMLTARRAW